MDLSDFVQPLVLEKADEFNLRQAKARFERVCSILGVQAFWLSVFEYLQKHDQAVKAVRFALENNRYHVGVAEMMEPVMIEGAPAAQIEKARKAFDGAMSKARGKIRHCDGSQLRSLARSLPANLCATLAGREEVLAKALGPDLYGLRTSRVESRELESSIAENFAAVLSGKSRGPRL